MLNDDLANLPRNSVHSENEAFEEFFESDCSVSGLVARSGLSKAMAVLYARNPMFLAAFKIRPPGDIHTYAERTGGEVIQSSWQEVDQKLAALLDHLRARYTLGYVSSKPQMDGRFRSISVKLVPRLKTLQGNRFAVRAKLGYYAR